MAQYVRVLAESDAVVPAGKLRARLRRESIDAVLKVTDGSDDNWITLELHHADGDDIAVIERNLVRPGELGADEIAKFIEEVADLRPTSAARWLAHYLPTVKAIYAFQLLSGVDDGDGWKAVQAMKGELWGRLGGIFQADGEGFSNTDGYHILWQFPDDVSGSWNMAVLERDGTWTPFEMELGNPQHRETFMAGQVPETAKRLVPK
jgi:hypothetical protein